MSIEEIIVQLAESRKFTKAKVTPESDFYTDLGFDSLEFVNLILYIENLFGVVIEIEEIALCLKVGALAALVKGKMRE